MTELLFLTNSYQKELKTKITSVNRKGKLWEIVLEKTIFYPQGGGQPSDTGTIEGPHGKAHVTHVRMQKGDVIHECSVEGTFVKSQSVTVTINWAARYHNMRVHTAGHIVHEAVLRTAPDLIPLKGDHGKKPYLEYQGTLPIDRRYAIEDQSNAIISSDLPITTTFVSFEELQQLVRFVPEHLPKDKPLRIMTIEGYSPVPDGGTHLGHTKEAGQIAIPEIENTESTVRIYYTIDELEVQQTDDVTQTVTITSIVGLLLDLQHEAETDIGGENKSLEELRTLWLGKDSEFARLSAQIRLVQKEDRQQLGTVINSVKESIEHTIAKNQPEQKTASVGWFDPTEPGERPPEGHLHIVSQTIEEITDIFAKIGFTRVRYPEVDWDYYAFEALNMPKNHPARDEWETFFIKQPTTDNRQPTTDDKFNKIVLTPHTSNGQVREMEKGMLPIRMINIAKGYRRQIDVSHTPMFHQFEGMYIDRNVSIGHLKGVLDYFAKQFYGPDRKTRIRPFHFQFTEPSFEVDITCGICNGRGCRLCKEGWLELGGSGMIHPNVLRFGGIDPDIYSGFAFGWGVERVSMMKGGTQLDDIRVLYGNDVRFLHQF